MQAIELHPLHEETARRLMLLLRDAGETNAALEVYRALRQRLSVVLGQAPSAQPSDWPRACANRRDRQR